MKEYHRRISKKQRDEIFDAFCDDALVDTVEGSMYNIGATERAGFNNPTTSHAWYRYFRECIYVHQMRLAHFRGTVEVDHRTFNARRKRRWRKVGEPNEFGRYRYEVVPTRSVLVFGLLERDTERKRHRVFVQTVRSADKKTTQPIVRHVVDSGTTLVSDSWRGFTGLEKDFAHKKVNHARKQYARKEGDDMVTTATIDQFWQYCARRLARFNGVASSTLHLHVQECAFRYTHRHDLRRALKSLLKDA